MPSERTSTGSPITSVLKRTVPAHDVVEDHIAPAPGTRKRMTAGSPFSMRRRASSRGMSRQRPTYFGGRPSASAA